MRLGEPEEVPRGDESRRRTRSAVSSRNDRREADIGRRDQFHRRVLHDREEIGGQYGGRGRWPGGWIRDGLRSSNRRAGLRRSHCRPQ